MAQSGGLRATGLDAVTKFPGLGEFPQESRSPTAALGVGLRARSVVRRVGRGQVRQLRHRHTSQSVPSLSPGRRV
ncbi:hypothetical protein AMK31_36195 [Streptomyces sp. TSRI0107]|nr:hypothetical protein AMK31_36195 [Streptomyces sp. TSRI0107]